MYEEEADVTSKALAGGRAQKSDVPAYDFLVDHYKDYSIWLTTFGRRTKKPRLVQIWFAFVNSHFYVFSRMGLKSQWAKNVMKNGGVIVNVSGRAFTGMAYLLEDEDMKKEIFKYYRGKYRFYPQILFPWGGRMLFEIELDELAFNP
jgi:deazaflavin-dependent oxidoreductase (nitroreductase family)